MLPDWETAPASRALKVAQARHGEGSGVHTTSTAGAPMHDLELVILAACTMARQGVQALRQDNCKEGDAFYARLRAVGTGGSPCGA